MLWPDHIRIVSLPSVAFCTLFLGIGTLTLAIAVGLPKGLKERGKFFWFGLTALSMAVYSFATVLLYSAPSFNAVAFWQLLQLASALLLFIFFVLFSARYLELTHFYWNRLLPLLSLAFLPLLSIRDWILRPVLSPKTFAVGSFSTKIFEFDLGPAAYVFIAWSLLNIFILGTEWFRYYLSNHRQWAIPLSFAVFFAAALNDGLVVGNVFPSFYLLEVGFLGFVFSMGYQIIHDYLETTQRLATKTQEVESLNEEMQFLVSSISHDLKSPLLSMTGFLKAMEELPAQDLKRREYFTRIQDNAKHMEDMLADLTQFMRLGRVEPTQGPVDLKRVMAEVLWILEGEGLCPRERCEVPEDWPVIRSCERSVKQILVNLLHNAFKFCPSPEARVRVDCRREANGVLIGVADRGPGVPQEMKEKIFAPFVRLSSKLPGTGMGLAIAKKLSENLGGRVWLDTDYREGARFCVYLPNGKL